MNFQVRISDSVEQSQWDQALKQNENSMTYQTVNWQRMFFGVYGSKPFFISVLNSESKIVGQLAGVIHKKWFWRDANIFSRLVGNRLGLGTLIHWFYGPIIHDKSHQDEIISKILSSVEEIAEKNNVMMIRGISPPLETNLSNSSFQNHCYELKTGATFIIDLRQGIENLYNSLKKDIRYYIRKSEKFDFKFEVVNQKKALDEFKNLKIAALKREGGRRVINTPTFYDKHWELLHNEGFEQLLVARKGNENVGGILTLTFNKNIIQHILANEPDTDLVGTFLTWNTIKWSMENNYNTFDFAGVNPNPQTSKEKGIYFYASKWGGKLYEYTVCTKITSKFKFNISSGLKNPSKISQINKMIQTPEI